MLLCIYKIQDKNTVPKTIEMIPNNLYVSSDAEFAYQLMNSSYKFLGIKNISPPSMMANNPINLINHGWLVAVAENKSRMPIIISKAERIFRSTL